jgi:hypothetical protein
LKSDHEPLLSKGYSPTEIRSRLPTGIEAQIRWAMPAAYRERLCACGSGMVTAYCCANPSTP